jgi:seryl-tRNA synthetase
VIDIKYARENAQVVKASQKSRGESVELVDELLKSDENRRDAIAKFESIRSEQNTFSKQVGAAKGDEKQQLLTKAKELANEVKAADQLRAEAEHKYREIALKISNIVDANAPVGGEADFKVLEEIGKPRDFAKEGFTPKDHVELGKILKAIDTERAAKVSGARFYYLTGIGALLELALVNLAVNFAVKAGFIPMIPPVLVKPGSMEGTGFLGQAAENVFHLKEDDFYLVGTSEVPLAAFHMDETIDNLPIRYAGISPCFRREAGTYGKDTRGIIRVHQFEKVEMFSFCHPDQAQAEHKRLLEWEKEFFKLLELPFRIIDVATADLGSSAVRKFDCEAWIPTQNAYREVTSTSNCTDFQARRLNIRFKDENGTKPVATLNGTLVAVPRTIVAILENHQQKDGSVMVPKALQGYLGTDRILPA